MNCSRKSHEIESIRDFEKPQQRAERTSKKATINRKRTGTAIDGHGGFGELLRLFRFFVLGAFAVTISRSRLVDTTVSRWYHCISRCVRRAHLLGDETSPGRKDWIENRLRELDQIFAVSVGGFSLMDNHLHLLLRIDPEVASNWSDSEVVERWFRLFPPRGSDRKPMKVSREIVAARVGNLAWVASARERLLSLGWFMKCLKEPLARMANKQDKCTGDFFEGRFKSIAILDEESLVSVCAYIDLNPVAGGVAATPEASEHTSIKARVEHVVSIGRAEDLKAAEIGSVAAVRVSGGLEDELWLVPVEDRRGLGAVREGMRSGFTLGQYVILVEYTGRMLRDGKAAISAEVADVFARLGCTPETWRVRMAKLAGGRLLGRFLAAPRDKLRELAGMLQVRHLANVG
ncbi:MAG: transposase [Pirellula sp.]